MTDLFESLGQTHGNTHERGRRALGLEDVLADVLLARALADVAALPEALRRGGDAIIIEAPSAEWTGPITDAFRRHLERSASANWDANAAHLDDDLFALAGGQELPRWHWLLPTPTPTPAPAITTKSNGADRRPLGQTLSMGVGVIGVCHTPSDLPEDLRRAADFHIIVPPPDWAAVREAMTVVTGTSPTTDLTNRLCRVLTPNDILLAARPYEAADSWVARLGGLAEAKVPRLPGPTLADLHGMDEATAWGRDLIHDLEDYAGGVIPWTAVDRGGLLYGPPGTGKTTFARALAKSAGLPLVTGSHSEWQAAGHQGEMLRAMRASFDKARALAPCILFIDEIDAFPSRTTLEGKNRDYMVQVVNGLLELLDGTAGRPGVVTVAACNHPGLLDPALVRPGRFDRLIPIPLPDEAALMGILRHHLGADHLPDACLRDVARAGSGATGADCEQWVRGARRMARRAGRPLESEDLSFQVPRPPARSADFIRRLSVHEAGHAVAAILETPGTLVAASIRPNRETDGGVLTRRPEIGTAVEILAQIRAMLAGRVAEELLLGSGTIGAGGNAASDLAQATVLAASMAASYGLDGGLTWIGEITTDNVMVCLRTSPALAVRVEALLAEQHRKITDLFGRHRPALEAVAALLREREIASGAVIEAVVAAASTINGEVAP